jgi:hypothetical protein
MDRWSDFNRCSTIYSWAKKDEKMTDIQIFTVRDFMQNCKRNRKEHMKIEL